MHTPTRPQLDSCSARRRRLAAIGTCALWVGLWVPGQLSHAMCVGDHIGRDGPIGRLIEESPSRAIATLKSQIADYRPDPTDPNGLAHRYAMLADAYYVGDEPDLASESVDRGLDAMVDRGDSALADRLKMMRPLLLDDTGKPGPALEAFEAYARTVSPSASYYLCVLYERGHLRRRNGRFNGALEDLLAAYDLARRAGNADDRAMVAESLAVTYSRVDFLDEAVRFADEAVAHYETDTRRGLLAHALLFRGDVFKSRGDYARAKADLVRVLSLAREVDSSFYQLFADVVLCEVLTKERRLEEAKDACVAAEAASEHLRNPEGTQAVNLTRAELDLALRRPQEALARLDKIPRDNEDNMPRGYQQRMHAARARALAAVGRGDDAYMEAQRYIDKQADDARVSSAEKIAALRTQIETHYKDLQLQLAQRERALLIEQISESRRNYELLALAFLLAIGIGAFIVMIQRKKRDAERAQHEAEQRLAAVAKLTGGIAHDFNNLMTVVQQAAGLLARHPALREDSDARALVGETQLAATTGGAITRQLLAFSRQLRLQPELIDLAAYFRATAPVLERTAGAKVALTIAQVPAGVTVWADRAQLTTALINVVSNSRDAISGKGSVTISARAAATREATTLSVPADGTIIEVTDTGCGIAEDMLERVVEPFYTTKDVTSGSGLGLSVVDGFATQSGGRLLISSRPGAGTTVSIVLPSRATGVGHGDA